MNYFPIIFLKTVSDMESKYDHSSVPFEDHIFPSKAKEERGKEAGGEKLTGGIRAEELKFQFHEI